MCPVLGGQRNASGQDERACAMKSSKSVDVLHNLYSESSYMQQKSSVFFMDKGSVLLSEQT